jgi:prepilin-type N-terminal cleavage/methylation domain-containing protein
MKISPPPGRPGSPVFMRAFTLLEVMIAMAIFFVAMFAILQLVGQNLRAARVLNQNFPDAGLLAAQLSLTNRLEEGTETGDFGNDFPGFTWTRDAALHPYDTNGVFFEVNWFVFRDGQRISTLSTLMYKPQSAQVRRAGGAR